MAKRFLTHVDLTGNQILNASFEKLSADPSSGNFEGRIYYNTTSDTLRMYDGTQWIAVGAITAVNGTTNEIDVSTSNGVVTISLPATVAADISGNAATATKLATSRTIELTGDVTGSASFDGSANASITATIAANSVELGTDTTGNYVASVSGSDGVSVSGTGEGASVTVANTDKGSSQNIFKNIVVGATTVVADNNDDTLTISAGTGIAVSANATTDTVTISNDGVTGLTGTANQIAVSGSTGSVTLSLPNAVTMPGTLTLSGDPTQALHAVTKQYADGLVSGLDWHESAHLLASSNIALSGSTGSLEIDGHTALTASNNGYRILLTGQTTASENGMYVYNDAGSGYTLTRSDDADTYSELVGYAVFIMEGTTYGKTSWVQSNHYLTSFNGQVWTQFSGAGTYVAGNGLALTGNSFAIDTSITVDKNTSQTLTNKTLTSPVINNPTVSGLYLSDNNIVIEGTADTNETTLVFTDPTADRTITFKDESGTVAFTGDITSAINALTTSDIEEGTNLYYTDERAQDAVGNNISGSNSLSATYNDGAGTFAFDTTLAATSYMSKTSGLAVDISAVETKLTTDGYSKKVAASVGNGTNTSFAVSHNLGTRDVVVNVYDNITYDTIECDVVRTDANTVTVSFASAPTSNAYRVVVIG